MDEELLKVLLAREQRWEMRRMLVKKRNSCLITVTLSVPVTFRISEEFWILFLRLYRSFYKILLSKGCQSHYEGYVRSDDGPALFLSTKTDAKEVKKICVEAEEVIPGGRMLDIDVMDSEGTPISRSDIGLPPRKCFVCENPAVFCVSRQRHSPNEISAHVKQLKEQIKSNYTFRT